MLRNVPFYGGKQRPWTSKNLLVRIVPSEKMLRATTGNFFGTMGHGLGPEGPICLGARLFTFANV